MSVQDKALLRAISEDRALGSAMLFAHRHQFESPEFHVEIMDAWRSADPFVLIEAFREGAKTTLSEEFLAMEGSFGNFFYTVLFGETYDKACQKLEAIAYECLTNVKLKKLFGKVLAKKPIENKIWFESGALIECAGWEQEITGFKYHDRRPDRAYLDDVENLERVRSTAAVDATMRKLYREVIPALDKVLRKVRVTETPRAADCMVTRLRANPDWACLSFPIVRSPRDIDDPEAESQWPSRYPMAWIRDERDRYARAGMLRQFMQEYMLRVDDAETKPFSEEMLRYVDIAPGPWLPRYAIFDPARTAHVGQSARTGKVVVSRFGAKVLVHESSGNYWKPDELRDDVFRTQERHKCAEVAIEKDSLDEYLMQPLRFEMLRRGKALPLRAMNAPHDRDKLQFIMGLHPFFTAGDIVLVGGKGMHPDLVAEIANFPGGKVDILNALAYALRMFAGQPVYEDFGAANIGPVPDHQVGHPLYLAWNASPVDVVCAVFVRHGRHWSVVRDFAATGPTSDAVKTIAQEVRALWPRATFESYAAAEHHDQWQRIALVPALRDSRLTPYRGEHLTMARGSLADLIRTTIRDRRLLTVGKDAPLTMNALSAGYKYALTADGRVVNEPEPGLSRLVAEALECAVAVLARQAGETSFKMNATNANGTRYHSALPSRG